MGKEIVVDINPYQTRVVLMDNGSPSEIYIEQRGKERLVGNVCPGQGTERTARHAGGICGRRA